MFDYEFHPKADKELQKLPKQTQIQIIKKLDFWTQSQNPLQFAERLINFEIGEYRFRVGNYRLIFDIEDDVIVILKVGHRKDVYR